MAENTLSNPLKSEVLADFIVNTRTEDIPGDIRAKTVRHILDSVGAGIAGAASKECDILMKTLKAQGQSQGAAFLWGQGQTMAPINAALFNGVSAHSFELDDTGGCDHSGAVVVPAAFAAVDMAKAEGLVTTGEEFVTAIVLGYDVARRALESCGAYAPHNKAGFHSTGTCGTFGAAAAAARLLKLDAKQTQMALGLAGSFSAGLWACVHDGAQSKRLHAGHAAQGGLMSACLARDGFTGPTQIFEQVWGGFDHTYAKDSDVPQAWTEDLGKVWKIHRVSVKPHASCRSTHSSIDAVDILRKKMGFGADDVEKIEIIISAFVHGMCGAFDRNPMPAAQLSIPYSVAADLIYGDAMLPSFSREKRNTSQIESLMKRISFRVDKNKPDLEEPTVIVTLKDGRVDQQQVAIPLGAPANPLSDEGLFHKFRSVVGMVYDETQANTLIEKLMGIDQCDDVYEAISKELGKEPARRELFDV